MSSELSWCYCCACPGPCKCLSPRKAKDGEQFINELDRIKLADDTRNSSDHHTCLALALKGLITSDQLESLVFYLRNQGCIDAFSSDDGEFGRKNKFLDIWSELERKGKIGPGDYDLLERGLRSIQALGHIQIIKEFHAKIQNEDGPDEGCIIDKKVVKDCEHLKELTDLYKPLLENGSSGVIFKNAAISLVGDEGGEVKMTNGSVTLEVPPGAVQTETVFSAFFSPNDDDPEFLLAPANGPTLSESDGIVKYSLPVRLGPSNIEFMSPVLLTVRDFSLPKESVKRMGVYRKTVEDNTWRSVGSCFYDKDCINNLTARILLNSFSIYVLGLPVLSSLLPLNVHVMVEQLTGTQLRVFFTLNDYSYNEEFVFEKKINVDCATCLYIDPSRDVDVIWIRRVVDGLSKKVGTMQASEKVVLQNDRIQNLAETPVFVSIPEPVLEMNSNHEDVLILKQNEEEGPLVEFSFNRSLLTPSEADLHATTEHGPITKGADSHPDCSKDGDEKQASPRTRREIGSLYSHKDESIEEDQNSMAQHATEEYAGTLEADPRPTMTDDGSEEQRQHYDLPSEVGSLSSDEDDSIDDDPDSLAEMAGTLTYSEEDIDNLTSILDAMSFCEDNLIDFGDLENLEEFKELLRKKLHSRVFTKHRNKRKKQLRHFMKTHVELRRHLGCVYEDLEKFFQRVECSENVASLCDKIVPSCRSDVVRNFERLRKESRVLVLGESGAGKSSLLNLLVGSPILPIDHAFSCTSTICELVQSETRDAYVEWYGSDQRLLGRLSLETDNPKLVQKKLAEVTNDTSVMCDPIRIHWPTKILPGNIMLVDSPGLSERASSDEKIMNYLLEADAVIVVINACMGRSALDRLGSLLHSLKWQENRVFNPRSVLFILNKMDQLPEEVRSKFREHSIKTLRQSWPGIHVDGEKQVLSMSVLQAQRMLDLAQGETAEYGNLVDAFYSLVETCLSTTHNYHKRWLSYVHGRLHEILQSMLLKERRIKDERTEMKKRLQEDLQQLQTFSDKGLIELEDNFRRKVNEIASALMAHLADETTVERLAEQCFMADQLNELPELKEENRLRCKSLIYQAAREEIIRWESSTQVIETARSSLIDELGKKFLLTRIRTEVTSPLLLTAHNPTFPMDDRNTAGTVTRFLRKLIGRDSREFREYKFNRRQYMLKLTRETMASLTHDNIKKQIMQTDPIEYVKEQVPLLRKYCIEELSKIEADEELTSGDTELGYIHDIELLNASFNHLHYIKLRYPEPDEADFYTASEVIMEEEFAHGSLGMVHFASVVLKGEQNPTKVAVKTMGHLIAVETATKLVYERDTLRCLTHENIVKYFGYSIIQDTFVFLMELCKCSLSDLIFGHKVRVPGKQDEQEGFLQAFKDMVDRALQISNGLAFIHSKNLVHGALKLSKILVTEVGVLKLCGMKQRGVEGPITRSQFYLSPEVLCGGMPTAQADIYSLGIVMYELWFGFLTYRDVFESGLEIDSIFEDIRRGDRKPMFEVKGYRCPVPEWCQLLKKCWKNTPSERISSRDIHIKLGKMLSEEFLYKVQLNVTA